MNEERRQILEMLAGNEITADEAERLIDALQRQQGEPPQASAPRTKGKPKYLRVVVDADDNPDEGPTRVNVRVPLALLRAGVRLTSLIPPQALTRANAELEKSGFPIDLTELKPQHLDDLIEALDELTVDVDQADTTVKVFCE